MQQAQVPAASERMARLGRRLILLAAFISFVLSVSLWFTGDDVDLSHHQAIFVGLWVPSILSLGAFLLAGMRASR